MKTVSFCDGQGTAKMFVTEQRTDVSSGEAKAAVLKDCLKHHLYEDLLECWLGRQIQGPLILTKLESYGAGL